ncbi:Uncharacterised protein [Legionella beliardensis]|uniref:Uncharacterized protein n=1 Tax=Legionella beliardensis TaxID=91822 RepID=A0A378JSA5_9GAMM|nr:Uncharacterised protein [Legionella beliardensis]
MIKNCPNILRYPLEVSVIAFIIVNLSYCDIRELMATCGSVAKRLNLKHLSYTSPVIFLIQEYNAESNDTHGCDLFLDRVQPSFPLNLDNSCCIYNTTVHIAASLHHENDAI